MKNNTQTILLALGLALIANTAMSAGFDVSKITTKGNDLIDILTGTLAITILTISIIISGLGLILKMGNPKSLASVCAGAVLILMSGQVAQWLMG